MKKWIASMLALVLCLTGFAFAEEADVSGVWYLEDVIVKETDEFLDAFLVGKTEKIILHEDGTMTGFYGDRWYNDTKYGNIFFYFEGETLGAGSLDGDYLNFDIWDSKYLLLFSRERKNVSEYIDLALKPDPTMQDFEGAWKFVQADMVGMSFSAEELGEEMAAEIAGGSFTKTVTSDGEEPYTFTLPVTLEDGMLIVNDEDAYEDYYLLLEDGRMIQAYGYQGYLAIFYFEKAE